MRQHKRYLVFLLVLAVSALVTAVTATMGQQSQTAVAETVAAPTVSPALPTVIVSADFAVVYNSLGELKKAADVIVRGEVTAISYLDFNSTTYTNVTFKVSECLKGDVAAGGEISIAEIGGVTTVAAVNGDKFGAPTDQDVRAKVSVRLDGAPLSQVGDQCLYFLGTGSIGVVKGTYYVPMGAFQGRFNIKNASAERFVPEGWQGKYTSLHMPESAIDQTVLRATSDK